MARVNEIFGSMVFNEAVMRERGFPRKHLNSFKKPFATERVLTLTLQLLLQMP